MCFRCLSIVLFVALPLTPADQRVLRVCSDPNNLPFSNEQKEGFENKLAELVAAKLDAKLEYTWWAQRKSFIKNSLDEGRCDLIMGVPSALNSVTTTKPYYRSSYVFVSRHDRNLRIASLADSRLDTSRIAVHVVGDDYAPPAIALARRGVTKNIVAFSLFGEYGEQNPARKIIDAVANGSVDVAIVWGPLAGYFAKQEGIVLDIVPISPAMFFSIPFVYDISAGVRKGNDELRAEVDSALEGESVRIQQILGEYGVPIVH